MTTFDDDFVKLHFTVGVQNLPCVELGLEWPPPEKLEEIVGVELGAPMIRTSMSEITDSQREGMTHVARGAEYFYHDAPEAKT